MATTNDELLIERYIVPDPRILSPIEARLRDSGYSVWAVIGGLVDTDGDIERTALEYGLPAEEMAAALAYFRANREPIEAKLTVLHGRVVRVPVPV